MSNNDRSHEVLMKLLHRCQEVLSELRHVLSVLESSISQCVRPDVIESHSPPNSLSYNK
jgi:hypothetical protein